VCIVHVSLVRSIYDIGFKRKKVEI